MNRKFIYFINPISGTKNKVLTLEIIQKRTIEKNIPFEILHTNAAGNYDEIKLKITTENITDIIVCGGDGSVNQICNAMLGVNVNIGIIPMGSGNGLAFAAKIPKNINKALDIIFDGHALNIDSFYINKRFSCMLCGLGFDAQVAHDFAKQKQRGLKTYIKQSFKNFKGAKPYVFELQVNESTIHTEAFFISIANSNQFGNNFTIAPAASLHDGLLDIVVVNKMNKLRMIWHLLKQIRKGEVKPYEDKKFHSTDIGYFQASNITIYNPSMAPLHIDGEPVATAAEFKIEIIENAFRLLMPL